MKNTSSKRSNVAAFTLIELLSVIGVIGILVAILIPAIGSVRLRAKTTKSASNLRQIGIAAIMHANENQGRYPSSYWKADDGWMNTLYLRTEGKQFTSWDLESTPLKGTIYWSPVVQGDEEWRTGVFCYGMNWWMQKMGPVDWTTGSNGDSVPPDGPLGLRLENPAATLMIADSKPGRMVVNRNEIGYYNSGKTAQVLFYDGHVAAMTEEEVQAIPGNDIFWLGGVSRPNRD